MPGGVFPFRKEFFALRPGALSRQSQAGHFAPGGAGNALFRKFSEKAGKLPKSGCHALQKGL